jgi:NitT/TauT family transport system substrate-binding protein
VRRSSVAVLAFVVFLAPTKQGSTAPKASFTVGWSVYVGYTPIYYMAKYGVLKKWADKYGITINARQFSYAASLDAFVSKNIDACLMTNMEALNMPAASAVETTAITLNDYSDGNDAVLTRGGLGLKDLPGKRVLLVKKTISQYLLERGMVVNGLGQLIPRIRMVDISDADIAGAFLADTSQEAVVTWKPMTSQILKSPGVRSVFDSSKLPGEIMDITAVRTEVLNRPDGAGEKFARALTGAWYETMALMTGPSPTVDRVLTAVAEASSDTLTSYKEQLSTTRLMVTPDSAISELESQPFREKMRLVRDFCFSHRLLGLDRMQSLDDLAIRYADGTIQGKPSRVRLRFESSYARMARDHKL